jgi:hypothetical protein
MAQDEVRRLLLGFAGQAARIGVKAGLAAFDSALSDVQRGARDVEKRVRRSRKKIAEVVEQVMPRAAEEDEDEEE